MLCKPRKDKLQKSRLVQAVNTTGQVEYNHDKHYPLAPEMVIPASLSTELTLLVKSSSTNVATLPLMPMKRFTLVRTT